MTIINRIKGWWCCHDAPHVNLNEIEPPREVRELSHDIANTASRVQARAHLVQKEAEFLLSFVRNVQGDKGDKHASLHR
jgi:hypothetical protein